MIKKRNYSPCRPERSEGSPASGSMFTSRDPSSQAPRDDGRAVTKKQNIYCLWLPLLALSMLAYWIHTHIYINQDAAIILHTVAQLFQGQTYTHDIFDPNPPMIFYLNVLPVIVSKLTGMTLTHVFPAYVIVLIVVSVTISRDYFKILFQSHTRLMDVMTFALAIILLFAPVYEFGEREHFMIILTMPYILLAATRLDNKTTKLRLAILTGVMAGIGFALKPFFIPTLLLIEFVFVYDKKRIFGWVRIESVIVCLIIAIYSVTTLTFYPDYLAVLLPLWLPFYKGIVDPWYMVMTYSHFLLVCAAIVLSCTTRRHEQYASIKIILSVTMVGFVIAYLIPRIAWFYHILPALSVACLYFVLNIAELWEKTATSSRRVMEGIFIGALAISLFSVAAFRSVFSIYYCITDFYENNPTRQLIHFLEENTANNTYDFLSISHKLYLMEFYSSAHYVGSFRFFWEFSRLTPGKASRDYRRHILPYVLHVVSRDLNTKKPRFIINDTESFPLFFHKPFDYPREYAKNKEFREAWSHYAYLKTIGPYEIFQRS